MDQADALADEMLKEARGATEKNAQAKRLLVDTLKWRAGKLKPKVYGERIGLEHGGPQGGPISVKQTLDVDLTKISPEEAARLYREFIKSTG